MTAIEEKSILTQKKLTESILSNYRSITYSITERGKEMLNLLKRGIPNDAQKTVTLSREDFDKVMDIVMILCDERKFDQLGILAKTAVPDNEIKLEILNSLK